MFKAFLHTKKYWLAVFLGLLTAPGLLYAQDDLGIDWGSGSEEEQIKALPFLKREAATGFNITGFLSTFYKFRTTGGSHDHDLETLLNLDMGHTVIDPVSGALQAGGIFDLDGTDTASPFYSVYDSFDRQAVERLYYAYINFNNQLGIDKIRIGRQSHYEFEALYFDGVEVEKKLGYGLSTRLFGGIPVHLFEESIGTDWGDWLVGSAISWQPIKFAEIRLDYAHLRDEVSGFRADVGDQEDDLFGLSGWWNPILGMRLYSRFTAFSDQVRNLELGGSYYSRLHRLNLELRLYTLLESYGIRVIDFERFGFVGTYEPFIELMANISKELGDNLAVDGGVMTRLLFNNEIASAFNHGFIRTYATLATYDLWLKGLSLALTGDYYKGRDNTLKNNTFGGSFDASQKLLEDKLELTAGTAFYLYRYNFFAGNESDNVQTFFSEAEFKFSKAFDGEISYEFENNDFDNFHTVDVKLTWNF